MPNPAQFAQQALEEDQRIPDLPASGGDRSTLLVPVYNPATDKTEQVPLGATVSSTFAALTDSPRDNDALAQELDTLAGEASNAQSTGDTAQAAANDAQDTADNALASANIAQSTANGVQASVNANTAALALKAPTASPSFTGSPTAPTAPLGSNNQLLANAIFVNQAIAAAIAALVDSAPGTLDTLGELAAALTNSNSALAALLTNVSGRLSIASNLADLASASAARANLGLGNVNNVSDANKPVSTATATALAGKQNVETYATLPYASSMALDFASAGSTQLLLATGNLTITTINNKGQGAYKRLKLKNTGSAAITLAFPAWSFLSNAAPTSLAAGKTLFLVLECLDAAPAASSDVTASCAVTV